MAQIPSFEKTSRLIARALGLTTAQLDAGFRPASRDDLAPVLALRKALLGANLRWDDAAYLTWRYHFGAEDAGRGECWVLAHPATGQVLGMVGSESFTVQHQGRAIDGMSVMDIAVLPEAEGFGLGVWMAMRMCRQVPCVLAVGSNPKSRGIVSQVFMRVPDRRCYALFLSVRSLARRRLPGAVAALAGAVDVGLKAWRWVRLPAVRRGLSIRPVTRFDASLDALIERAHDPAEVSIQRSAAALNWRLFDIPRTRYTVQGAYGASGELLGYLAAQIVVSPGAGRILVIEDLVADRGQFREVQHSLLSNAIALALRERCERVSMIACHAPTEKNLRRTGFLRHGNDYETLSVACSDPALSQAIEAGTPLHLAGIHTDRDVF